MMRLKKILSLVSFLFLFGIIVCSAYSVSAFYEPVSGMLPTCDIISSDGNLQRSILTQIGTGTKTQKDIHSLVNVRKNNFLAFNKHDSTKFLKTQRDSPAASTMYMSSEFPLGIAFGTTYRGEKFAQILDELGTKSVHINTRWKEFEPSKGKFNRKWIDAFLNQLEPGTQAMIRIKSISQWATKSSIYPSAPLNMDDYFSFVHKLVKFCKGKVKLWQTNWEPEMKGFWEGTKEEYVATMKTFYKAVKSADPEAVVVGGGHSGAWSRGEPVGKELFDFIFKEGRDYFDVFDIHLFGPLYGIPKKVRWFKKRMKVFGFHKPFVCAAYGGPSPSQFEEARQYLKEAERIKSIEAFLSAKDEAPPQVQMFLVGIDPKLEEKRHRIHSRDLVARTVIILSTGIRKLWYWDLVERELPKFDLHPIFGKMRLMDTKLSRRLPAFYTYQQMARNLKGVKSVRPIPTHDNRVVICEIERRGKPELYIVWERRDLFKGEDLPSRPFELEIDAKEVKVASVFGIEEIKKADRGKVRINISDTPLYVERIK